MNALITKNLKEIIAICKRYKVQSLYIFGSANTNAFDTNSDLDFLIKFDKNITFEEYTDNYFELHYKFRELLNREIDLVTENSISNPYFKQEIEQNKQLVYAA